MAAKKDEKTSGADIVASAPDTTPTSLMHLAVDRGLDADQLEKIMAVWERDQANVARNQFYASMCKVQEDIRPVVRDANNHQTRSMYARLETVHKAISPIYTARGFSVSHDEDDSPQEGMTRYVAIVRHRDGHMETFHLDLPLDDAGIKGSVNKTGVHAKASSSSYARRILETRIFNVVFDNEDDDGNAAGDRTISADDVKIISLALKDCPPGTDFKVLKFAGVDTVPDIPAKKLFAILKKLNATATTADHGQGPTNEDLDNQSQESLPI